MKKFINPNLIGVYFLYKNDTVVYVGQSKNIEMRIYQHERTKDFDRYNYVLCNENLLKETEEAFILRYQPVLNKKIFAIETYKEKNKVDDSMKEDTISIELLSIDHKILAKHFNKTIQAMHQLKQKWTKEKQGLWIVYVKAYNYDMSIIK
jgi:hypothetical protein